MLYSFAGYIDDKKQSPIDALNSYNITSDEWSNITVYGGDFNYYTRVATSRAVSTASSEALGFVQGGWNDVPGMIRFDASDPAKPQWHNETDNHPPLTLEGSMQFIRLGRNGSLVNFGGYNKDYINPNLTGWSYDRRSMDQINVYDINSATWFNVTAGGDVPGDRSAFCTAVSSAPDDSSFQITLYAGWDLFGGHSFADTYVLSIPSFQWINVTDASNRDAHIFGGPDISGRDHHECAAYKERQMLVLGGNLRNGRNTLNQGRCNESLPAVRALDLSTFKWSDTWDGSPEPYYVPDVVTRIIGGTRNGGATKKQPDGGFNDSALNSIFSNVAARYTPVASTRSDSGNSSSHPGGGGGGSTSKTNTGAIAGGTVGGVAFIAIIATIIFILLRRRKRRSNAPPLDPRPQSPWDGKPLEMSGDSHISRGVYYNPPAKQPSHVAGAGYKPLTQEMDGGHRGSELMADGDERRPIGELPG